jgi:hypothetical protein
VSFEHSQISGSLRLSIYGTLKRFALTLHAQLNQTRQLKTSTGKTYTNLVAIHKYIRKLACNLRLVETILTDQCTEWNCKKVFFVELKILNERILVVCFITKFGYSVGISLLLGQEHTAYYPKLARAAQREGYLGIVIILSLESIQACVMVLASEIDGIAFCWGVGANTLSTLLKV